jgi:hypothetical protein
MKVEQITVQFTADGNNPQTLELDGIKITIESYTNRADGGWYLDFYDDQGAIMFAGIAVVTGLDLWYPYHYKAGIPPGQLFVLSQTDRAFDPTLDTFSDASAILVYMS